MLGNLQVFVGQDAINAVQCGFAMRREVLRLNETRTHASLPVVRIDDNVTI